MGDLSPDWQLKNGSPQRQLCENHCVSSEENGSRISYYKQMTVSSCLAAPLPKEDLLPVPPTLPIRPLPKSSTAKLRRRILCDFWEGSCRRGSDCPWAHNTDEMQVARVQVSKDGRRKNERRQANQKRHTARMVCTGACKSNGP